MGRSLAGSGLFEKVLYVGSDTSDQPETEFSPGFFSIHFARKDTRQLSLIGKATETMRWSRVVEAYVEKLPVAVISCHSAALLALSFKLAHKLGARVVYEPHELESETSIASPLRRRAIRSLESRLVPKCAAVNVVGMEIAKWYESAYKIERPAVVRNIPDVRMAGLGDPVDQKGQLGLKKEDFLFLYQGALSRGRRIPQLMDVFEQAAAGRHLLFLGYGVLEQEIRERAKSCGRIHILPAVPPSELLRHTQGADIGWCGVENICLSYYLSLPNKLFEFILAGIPQVAPDWPEIGPIMRQNDLGWLHGETTEEMIELVNSVSWAEVARHKSAAELASSKFSWQDEERQLILSYKEALK